MTAAVVEAPRVSQLSKSNPEKRTIEKEQFFSTDETVEATLDLLEAYLDSSIWRDRSFLEPSVGSGAFYRGLLRRGVARERITAVDLEVQPAMRGVAIEGDFLEVAHSLSRADYIAVGNPPFGRAQKLSNAFLEALAAVTTHQAMVLPRSARLEHRLTPSVTPVLLGVGVIEDFQRPDGSIVSTRCVSMVFESKPRPWPSAMDLAEERGYFSWDPTATDWDFYMDPFCMDRDFPDVLSDGLYHFTLKAAHPLVLEAWGMTKSEFYAFTRVTCSKLRRVNLWHLRFWLNRYFDARPEKKAVLHRDLGLEEPRSLFDSLYEEAQS